MIKHVLTCTAVLCSAVCLCASCGNRAVESTDGGDIVYEVASTDEQVMIDVSDETDPHVNIDYIRELIGEGMQISDAYKTSFDEDDNWIRKDYSEHDTSNNVENSFIFGPIQFTLTDSGTTETVEQAMTALRTELENEGFALAKEDEFSREHYTNGNTEFVIWNVSNSDKNIEIKAMTGAQACCVTPAG